MNSEFNNSNNLFSDFTKKYTLSKTLRFELKPFFDTKKHLDTFIELDTQRAEDYKKLKKIIDEYHKNFIEQSFLDQNILKVENLKNLSELLSSLKKSTPKFAQKKLLEEELKKQQKELRKQVSEQFKKSQQNLKEELENKAEESQTKSVQKTTGEAKSDSKPGEAKSESESKPEEEKTTKKSGKNPLFEKQLITVLLPEWLNSLSYQNVQNQEPEEFQSEEKFLSWKKESLETVKKFEKFTTYLTGFHDNRKNMYSDQEQSTAIAYRIVHENLPRFLSNTEVYKKITKNFPELQKKLENLKTELKEEFDYLKIHNIEDIFEISFFNKFLTQKGIDNYNCIIGGKNKETDEQKSQGINEIINQYRQSKMSSDSKEEEQSTKTRFNNKNLPLMQILYKQILSDQQSHSFYDPEEFKSREQVLSAIDEFWQSLFKKSENKNKDYSKNQNILQEIEELLIKKLIHFDLDKVYFKSSSLNDLSQKLFADHQVIPSAFDTYTEKSFSTKKEGKKWRDKSFFSFKEIHEVLFSFSEEKEDYEILLPETSPLFLALSFYAEKNSSGTKKEQYLNKKLFSFKEIKSALSVYMKERNPGSSTQENILLFYFQSELMSEHLGDDKPLTPKDQKVNQDNSNEEQITNKAHSVFTVLNLKNLYQKVKDISHSSSAQDKKSEFNKNEIECIQIFLQSSLEFLHFIKPIHLEADKKKVEELDKDLSFYNDFDNLYEKLKSIIPLYNKTRNYITAKKNRLEKIKINFEDSTLLNGWDLNKERKNLSVIFRRWENGQWMYYLGVMNPHNRTILDYQTSFGDKETSKTKSKKLKNKKDLMDKILVKNEDNNTRVYEKMNYKQLPSPDQNLPRVFFSNKRISYFKPSEEIKKIKSDKSYTKASGKKEHCHKFIDFLKESIKKHPDWKQFNFKFSSTSQYENISDFYQEVASQGYKLSFDKIKADYIEEKVRKGELYLFKIYNKDFSENKGSNKGRPNLHTSYFKLLFDKENLRDTVFKLNGEAEIFYRKASVNKKTTHKKNYPIPNKKPNNPKKTSNFKYDIIKDKRFTEDKFFLHLPITLNFKNGEMKNYKFNQEVLQFLKDNKNINIIGLDRGERHLAYYTVVDQKRNILEQGSFNEIINTYKSNHKNIEVVTNYHTLLEKREKERDKSRKSWTNIETIKDLKAGYLSHLVHHIAKLMIKYNAIVVFEDLNEGFKRGRMKFEKQVYQKLEKALIDKLNYLALKEIENYKEPGGFLKAYQLTAPFESFKKMGKQTGFIFYTPAYYTSKVCPLTGFSNLIYPRYENVKKSQDFFKKFNSIYFNSQAGYFVFEYKDGEVNNKKKLESNALWKACSYGGLRYRYDYKTRSHKKINVTEELKALFEEYNIPYKEIKNLKDKICDQDKKDFWFRLMSSFKLILELRHINPKAKNENEKDFILSPVAVPKTGRFFDSREAKENEPKNADANGAYHIALKGLWTIQNIIEEKNKLKIKSIKNKEWFDFIRK